MSNRVAPGALDLAVAFVSGMVAAYAFGRPHLLSVLPGIAIASSLVPPLATAGLTLVTLDLNLTLGAILLFLSNFVAIVLGSAFALWVVGMRGPREICPFTAWAQRYMFCFCVIAVSLAVLFAFRGDASQLQASSFALNADQATPDVPSEDAMEQPQLASDERKIRVVFKPVTKEDGQTQSPSITVVIPNKKPTEEQDTTVEIEGLPEPPHKDPLFKWLKEHRAMFPFGRRTEGTNPRQTNSHRQTPIRRNKLKRRYPSKMPRL